MRPSKNSHSIGVRAKLPLLVAGLFFGLFAGAQTADAQTVSVFHSPGDDGLSPTLAIPLGTTSTIHLYVDGGLTTSAVGEACEVGTGEELCAVETALAASGGVTLLTFTPATGAQGQIVGGVLRANRVDAVSGVVGPTKIGDLLIDTGVMGTLELQSGAYVDAALQMQPLAPTTALYVPEPSFSSLLGSSLLLLVALRRARSSARD